MIPKWRGNKKRPKFRSKDWKSHTKNWRFGCCTRVVYIDEKIHGTKTSISTIFIAYGLTTSRKWSSIVGFCQSHFLVAHLLLGLKLGLQYLLIYTFWWVGGKDLFLVFLVRRKRVSHYKDCLLLYANTKERWRPHHGISWSSLLLLAKDVSLKRKG